MVEITEDSPDRCSEDRVREGCRKQPRFPANHPNSQSQGFCLKAQYSNRPLRTEQGSQKAPEFLESSLAPGAVKDEADSCTGLTFLESHLEPAGIVSTASSSISKAPFTLHPAPEWWWQRELRSDPCNPGDAAGEMVELFEVKCDFLAELGKGGGEPEKSSKLLD